MKNLLIFYTTICLFVSVVLLPGTSRGDELLPEQAAFCKEQLEAVVELFETRGTEAALTRLDEAYALAEQQFSDTHFFYRKVWWEAQTLSGHSNEEWGLQLYLYLLDRTHEKNPETAENIPANDYVLYGNISECLRDLGKAAQARSMIAKVEESQRKYRHLDNGCTSYPDLGPLFSFLPGVRKRNYPLFRKDAPTDTIYLNTDPNLIYYPYIYGIGYAARAALDTGDWIRAAELNDWFVNYVIEAIKAKHEMRHEICRCGLDALERQTRICLMHGHPEEAIRLYDELLEKIGDHADDLGENLVYDARLDRELVKIELGTIDTNAIAIADKADELIAADMYRSRMDKFLTRLSKARVYHALGQKTEAWEIVETQMRLADQDVNHYFRIAVLGTAIDFALADGAVRPELEEWLVLALDSERQMGNKFGELPLYEKYARFLMMKERFAEAEQILCEAVRLSKAMNLQERFETNRNLMAELTKQNTRPQEIAVAAPVAAPGEPAQNPSDENNEPAPANTSNAPATGGGTTALAGKVDVQPLESLTVAREGQPAYGRFYVYNPTSESRQGTLRISGPINTPNWQEKLWVIVGSSPDLPRTELESELTIPSGGCCVIDIAGLPKDEPARVECTWIAKDQAGPLSGRWEYQTDHSGKRTAVIDAHAYSSNPFYLIPIHHMIQRSTSDGTEVVDITVEASSPMRIEMYLAATGTLVSVDANGDGDFLDRGDYIGIDENGNNWPDFTFEDGQNLTSLVMYVKPIGNPATQALQELTIKRMENGVWQIDAVDVIASANDRQ
jgi:hypothetical protein